MASVSTTDGADEVAIGNLDGLVGYWKLECAFCARVAPHVSVRVPHVYAVAERGSRFVLLLENVAALVSGGLVGVVGK